MKKIFKNINTAFISCLGLATLLSGCSDQFLKDKTNYDSLTEETVYNNFSTAEEAVNYLYYYLLPSSTSGVTWQLPSTGVKDINSASTEEYPGLSSTSYNTYTSSSIIMDNTTVPDYFYVSAKTYAGPYGLIRPANAIIEGVTAGTLTDDEKAELLGQAYFFRAWIYYRLVDIYGGVPIIDHVQDAISSGEDLNVARSTTKECIDFICSDLQKAAQDLPLSWDDNDRGRVTAGTALALEGRVKLLYASPLFNRADDATRWEEAYEVNKDAIDTLTLGGFGLANVDAPGTNGSGWDSIFSDYTSSEAVFVTLYNDLDESTDYQKWNGWENKIRPANARGGGGIAPTAQMIDMFPMSDGQKPSDAPSTVSSDLSTSSITYDPQLFFLNRDPRFYRTFAFPGEYWTFSGTTWDASSDSTSYPYQKGSSYALWSYCWYSSTSYRDDETQTGYAADALGSNNKSVFVRKRSDDYEINTSPLYTYSTTYAFKQSAAPYMEIRYAEVLLNFAESACGVGTSTTMQEAVDALIQIRKRAGLSAGDDGMYGLDTDLATDRPKLFAAILYERQIELAYEGKRFEDMRRWLLWDGGANFSSVDGAPSDWTLTGFDGNTCTYLGVTAFNGQSRDGIEIRLNDDMGTYTEASGYDPIKSYRPTPLDLMSDISSTTTNMGNLVTFYDNYLYRKTTQVDGGLTIAFQPEYYFLGLRYSAQLNNSTLKQTIGWGDYENGGANGTFDPIAE